MDCIWWNLKVTCHHPIFSSYFLAWMEETVASIDNQTVNGFDIEQLVVLRCFLLFLIFFILFDITHVKGLKMASNLSLVILLCINVYSSCRSTLLSTCLPLCILGCFASFSIGIDVIDGFVNQTRTKKSLNKVSGNFGLAGSTSNCFKS